MNKCKRVLLVVLIFALSLPLSSCWNYREIEKLAIVVGMAIDIAEDGQFLINAEIANPQAGSGGQKIEPLLVHAKGSTIFDAVRGIISRSGRRLYWSHTKVYIISESVAKDRLLSALDWISRDSETRLDSWLLLSTDKWAYEVLKEKPTSESLMAFQLDDILQAQKSLSRFPSIELYKFIEDTETGAHIAICPKVDILYEEGKGTPHIHGTAIFKKAKLLGFLDEEESKDMLAVRNELKGGLYIVKNVEGTNTNIALEIFKNKTKIKPVLKDGKLVMEISISPIVNIAEISSSRDYINTVGRAVLKAEADKQLKADTLNVIKKAQQEYGSDVFGFGSKIKREMPKLWRQIEPNWEDQFRDLEVSVNVNVKIRGSATTKEPIEIKD